ncbi:MAG: MerR family transcriptional regulator [Gammaproteobacteria bacterium]|nr:MerR family transcriptional regulator [Gammaproteobacteria bacterium]
MSQPLTISRVARRVGVGVETIRYYQRIGLLEEPVKPTAGYRIYPQETIDHLLFIQRAKDLGFSLAEIAQLLELGEGGCHQSRDLAANKLELIMQKVSDLNRMADALKGLVAACDNNADEAKCPLIETLTQQNN